MALQDQLKIAAIAAALVTSAAASSAVGGTITYSVDQIIGAGSVVGTITTDGATGVLGKSDVVGWNLELNGVGASINLNTGNSNVLVGNGFDPFNPAAGNADFTADATHLFFNYDGLDKGYLGFQIFDYSGFNYWCNASANQGFDCVPGKSVAPQSAFDPSAQFAAASGDQVIGIVVASGVPEPAAWALLLAGFGGLGLSLRSRRQAAAATA